MNGEGQASLGREYSPSSKYVPLFPLLIKNLFMYVFIFPCCRGRKEVGGEGKGWNRDTALLVALWFVTSADVRLI